MSPEDRVIKVLVMSMDSELGAIPIEFAPLMIQTLKLADRYFPTGLHLSGNDQEFCAETWVKSSVFAIIIDEGEDQPEIRAYFRHRTWERTQKAQGPVHVASLMARYLPLLQDIVDEHRGT